MALSIPSRERWWLWLGPGESVLGSSARLGLSPAPAGTLGTSAPSRMAMVPAADPFLIEAERGKNHLGARLVAQCSQGYGGWVTPLPLMAIPVPTGPPQPGSVSPAPTGTPMGEGSLPSRGVRGAPGVVGTQQPPGHSSLPCWWPGLGLSCWPQDTPSSVPRSPSQCRGAVPCRAAFRGPPSPFLPSSLAEGPAPSCRQPGLIWYQGPASSSPVAAAVGVSRPY